NEGTASLNAHIGSIGDAEVVFHLDGSYRKTKDFDIPGFAESEAFHEQEEHEEEHEDEDDHDEEEGHDEHDEDGHDEREGEAFGTVENSATKTRTASAGLSFIFPNGFIGMNVKVNKSDYGVPAGHEHGHGHEDEHEDEEDHHDEDEHEGEEDHHDEDGHEEEVPVTIDLDQVRFDVHGEYSGDFGFFKKAKFRFGYADYEHIELEGTEIGTVFKNEGWESRLDLIDEGGENWGGASGIHYRYRDFSAVGEEAFVPATTSKHLGLYTVKEYHANNWHLDAGVRFEHTKYDASTVNANRTFNSFSGSVGVGYDLSEDLFFGVNLSRTERAPSTEELFSNGPHLATNAFERGDSSLGKEKALGVDATLSYAVESFSLVLNGFYTSYDNFIYETETGEEEDGLEVFQFQANDAKLYGFEAKAEAHLGAIETGTFGNIDVHLDGQIDLVRAELDISGNDNLPRIPPLSALVGIETRSESFDLRTEIEHAAKQTRVTEHELPTDSYTLWNAYLTLRPFDNKDISFEVRGTNLTNNEARQHTSFLKDRLPLPGRNVKASVRIKF
ncbi:MAG: TonB-dependent receptor, partial [Kordiimonas sp.]